MLCGGIAPAGEVSEEHIALVNRHTADLNNRLQVNNTSYTPISCSHQLVNGNNHFFHLTGSDGQHYTATIHEPFAHTGEPSKLTEATQGHNAHCHGHGH